MTLIKFSDDPVFFKLEESRISLARKFLNWNRAKIELLPLVKSFQALGADFEYTNGLDIKLTGDKNSLISAFKIFRSEGYQRLNPPPQKGDTTWYSSFKSPDRPTSIWFYFSSSVCRRVQTGTQLKEVPVYETICDELSLPISEGGPSELSLSSSLS